MTVQQTKPTRYNVDAYPLPQDIQRGIDYLDEAHPGWERVVDVAALDMVGAETCVLGQLDPMGDGWNRGNYWHYLSVREFDEHWAEEHGFTARDALWLCDPLAVEHLTYAWQAAITQKRAGHEDV